MLYSSSFECELIREAVGPLNNFKSRDLNDADSRPLSLLQHCDRALRHINSDSKDDL